MSILLRYEGSVCSALKYIFWKLECGYGCKSALLHCEGDLIYLSDFVFIIFVCHLNELKDLLIEFYKIKSLLISKPAVLDWNFPLCVIYLH